MGDEGDFWRAVEEDEKEHRKEIAKIVEHKLDVLKSMNFKIEKLTDWQIRIDGRLDIYWRRKRYHDIKLGKRGSYNELIKFVKNYFRFFK